MANNRNDTIKTILSRTCCRVFNETKRVKDEDIKVILRAGQASPSAKNRQPWYFIVIKNQNVRKQIAEAAAFGRQKQFANWDGVTAEQMISGDNYLNSNDGIIAKAPVLIIIFRNSDFSYSEAITEKLDIKEESGVACSAYSILLAASAIGLGACWLCSALYIENELKKVLTKTGVKWDDNWQPRAFIPIGYPRGKPIKPNRKTLTQTSARIN